MADCTSRPYRKRSNRGIAVVGAWLALGTLCLAADKASDGDPARVTAVRFWSLGDTTRIAIEVSADFRFKYERLQNPDRLFFDIFGTRPEIAQRGVKSIPVDDALVNRLRVAETQPGVTRVVIDLKKAVELTTSQLSSPNRLIVEVKLSDGKAPEAAPEVKPAETKPAESKPAEIKITESKPVEKPAQAKAAQAKPGDARAKETKAAESKPVENRTAEAKVAEVRPQEIKPLERRAKEHDAMTSASASSVQADAENSSEGMHVASFEVPASLPKVSTRSAALDVVSKPAKLPPTTLASLPPTPVEPDPVVAAPSASERDDVKEVLPPKPGALNDRSLVRTLGLKLGRVVIDAGHGGNDVGTHGPSGYLEKDLSLDVARRLAALVRENMGSDVVMTRSEDVYVGLEERTRIANEHKADLFLSIHANSSPYRSAAGVETFVLNFTTNKSVMDLATRENAGSEMSIHDLQDLLQKIALRDKVDESRELASRLQTSLSKLSTNANDAARNRGVKKAPFVVLIGANMPSVLAEIGFLTNATDEALLRKPEHRQKIAEALYKGIASYADTLSQVVARKN
jgi:N-acetylmuramoyl-L-alanine amidase